MTEKRWKTFGAPDEGWVGTIGWSKEAALQKANTAVLESFFH